MSVFVRISNFPPGMDEKDLAELLLKTMDASGTTFRQCFRSCEIRHEESVAVLEFECQQNISKENPWAKLAFVKINGRILKIVSDTGVPSLEKHKIVRSSVSSSDVKNSDLVSSTVTSEVPLHNGNINGAKSTFSKPVVANGVVKKNMFEDMDVDEGVVSAEETSPSGTPPDTTANDNLLYLLSDVTTSTSAYFPTLSSEVDTVEKVELQTLAPNEGCLLAEPTTSCGSGVGVNGSISSATSSRIEVPSSETTSVSTVPPLQSVSVSQGNVISVILSSTTTSSTSSLPKTCPSPLILPKLVPITNGSVTKPVAVITPKPVDPKSKPLPSQPASGRPKRMNQAASQPTAAKLPKLSSPATSQSTVGIPNKPLTSGKRVVFFDLETTGLDRDTCEIVQIAAACGDAHFNVYIKPVNGIPIEASRVNGLTVFNKQLLKNGVVVPVTEHHEAWKGLIHFLKGLGKVFLVGHNADWFDFPLMARDIKKTGMVKELKAVVAGCIDSLLMFRSRFSYRRKMSFKQDVLAKEYGISTSDAHDALGDVRILEQLCKKIGITESDYVQFRKPVTRYL